MPRAAKAARVCGPTPASANDDNVSPDPLQGRICRDDQDTVTVTAREDPSERAGRSRPRHSVYRVPRMSVSRPTGTSWSRYAPRQDEWDERHGRQVRTDRLRGPQQRDLGGADGRVGGLGRPLADRQDRLSVDRPRHWARDARDLDRAADPARKDSCLTARPALRPRADVGL